MHTPLFAEILDKGADLRFKVTGRSMHPFLADNDIVTLRKTDADSLKRGDIIFYLSDLDTPVLHRIIDRSKEANGRYCFITKGDRLFQPDRTVPETRILGRVCSVEKNSNLFWFKKQNHNSPAWRFLNPMIALISRLRIYHYSARFLGLLVK
jgi:signal peptidase I